MAFLSVRQIFLTICAFGLTIGSVSADCDATKIEGCLAPLIQINDGSDDICNVVTNFVQCIEKFLQDCPDAVKSSVDKALQQYGVNDLADFSSQIGKCCHFGETVAKVCINESIAQEKFIHTDEQCSYREHVWNCTRPYAKELAKNCHIDMIIKQATSGEDKIIDELNTCAEHGYKVTVDYPGGAGNIAWSPVMTFFVSLATAILIGYQVR